MPDIHKAGNARFGPFEIDFSSRELRKHGLKLKISGQPIQILEMLLETPAEVVSREQIRERLWPANTFVDFDHGLNAAINKLREALGDSADSPRYIETVPRRGYRFIADVLPANGNGTGTPETKPDVKPAPVMITSPAKHPRLRLFTITLTAVCLVALLLAYLLLRQNNDWRVSIAREAQLTTSSDLAVYPTFSPDATRLAYSVDRGHGYEIVVQQIEGAQRELPVTDDGQQNIQAAWSPDGQVIAYHSRKRQGIWAIPSLGGPPRRITHFGSHPSWSPDGKWIAFQSGPVNDLGADAPGVFAPSVLWIVRPDGTDARQITTAGNPEGGHGAPSWSPDGRRIVFVSLITHTTLFTVDVQSGEVKPVGKPAPIYFDPVYSADGASIFFGMMSPTGLGLFQMPISKDGSTGQGEPVQLKSGDVRVRNLALSRDGTKLLYSGVTQSSGIWSISATGKKFGEPVVLRQRMGDRTTVPKISPDGQRVLVASWRTGVCCEIWMVNRDGTGATMLTAEGIHPKWLPDGRNIVYISIRGKVYAATTTHLQKLNIDTREAVNVAELSTNVLSLDVSPDGRLVVYQVPANGATNLWTLDLKTGSRQQLTSGKNVLVFPVWSPDGLQIAANSKRRDDDQAFIVSAKDGHITQLTSDSGQHWPGSWSKDGRQVIAAVQHDGIWNVYSIDVATRTETPLTRYTLQNAYVRYPQISPDGKQVIYEHTETRGNIWMLSLTPSRK
ncbi:MAG TPA: winged helix-turn-helix domain-containing protein [Terriglobales bacterium]|nr:winged helix-turn-helix domain-containing protein [Terriglobales bacterium]